MGDCDHCRQPLQGVIFTSGDQLSVRLCERCFDRVIGASTAAMALVLERRHTPALPVSAAHERQATERERV